MKIVGHIILIFAFIITPYLFSPDFGMGWQIFTIPPFVSNFIGNIMLCVAFYVNMYWLFPKLYPKNKHLLYYSINGIILAVTFSILLMVSMLLIGHHPPHPDSHFHNHHHFLFVDFGYLIKYPLVVSIVVMYNSIQMLKEIQFEKSKTELAFLKAQINPHFLFNTMNAIYALTLKKSDLAPEAIQKLSGIMRYMFAEGNQDVVSLSNEINYLKDYVALQKMRINPNKTVVQFEENASKTDYSIAPMLLYPFVENAFKYGVNPEEQSMISIQIDCNTSGVFNFYVSNTITTHTDIAKNDVGLANTKKRLELVYPHQHQLQLSTEGNTYIVSLQINLG